MANGIIDAVSTATGVGSGLSDGGAVDVCVCGGGQKSAYRSLNKCYLSIN